MKRFVSIPSSNLDPGTKPVFRNLRALSDFARRELEISRHKDNEYLQTVAADAKREGFKAGLKQAYEDTISAERIRSVVLEKLEREICPLVVAITKEVIGTEIKTTPESLARRIRRALKTLRRPLSVEVVVNKKDEALLNSLLHELNASGLKCTLVSSDRVEPGDALIQSPFGNIRASMAEHLETIKSLLENSSGWLDDLIFNKRQA